MSDADPEAPTGPTGPLDYLALFVGTGAGTGYAPVASGTFGTLPAVAAVAALGPVAPGQWVLLTAAVTAAAIWAAARCRHIFGQGDPSRVVSDEIAGFFVTMSFVPVGPWTLVAGFALFRLFDVVKPPPVRQLEALPGGWGVVVDDLMAGVYANLCLHFLLLAGLPV